MATSSYDIHFSGELMPGAQQQAVRARIQEMFKLTDQAADQLFSGRTIAIKRNLDHDQAVRIRDAFRQAGAQVQLVERSGEPDEAPANTGLSLAPVDDRPLEPAPEIEPPSIDISSLSLIAGEEWTLEDCETPPPPVSIPDISHLQILEPEPAEDQSDDPDDR